MTRGRVYEFESCKAFLNSVAKNKESRRPTSLGHWARRLGYRSQRSIGMVLNGNRPPTTAMLRAWARALKLDDNERRYLELLAEIERSAQKGQVLTELLCDLQRLAPKKIQTKTLDVQRFAFISEWYHFVIKQLIGAGGFSVNNIGKLSTLLRNKVNPNEIRGALKNLEKLGFVSFNSKTKEYRVLEKSIQSTYDIPSAAIRKHHEQMMERAKEALYEISVENREMLSTTFCFDIKRIKEAKEALREFRNKFESRFAVENTKDVYQMNLQFFPHTKGDESENE